MQHTDSEPQSDGALRLRNFPVSFFAAVMGLGGLTLAWQRAGFPVTGQVLWVVSAAVCVLLTALYAAKAVRFPQAVRAEFAHPVTINFFPTFSIGLLLLAVGVRDWSPLVSNVLWIVGAIVHLALTVAVMSYWINHRELQTQHVNPAWFIPVVGNIIVPIAAVPHGAWEVAWLFFAIGVVFWLVLLTLVFYRLIFHPPLPDKLVPTLAILVAPPAAGFLAYVALSGGRLDGFARVLYGVGLFLLLLLAAQLGRFARLKFFLSWWAYSFPLAALTLATLRITQFTGQPAYRYLGVFLLALLSAVLALLAVRTLLAVARREICVEET